METFGKKMTALRKEKKMSQGDLAKRLNTSISVVGRYERDEMTPSIEVAKNIASLLGSTVGYLMGETEQVNILKDPQMLDRLNDINHLSEKEREALLMSVDAFLRDAKTRKAYAK
jgi:transcriptional regulator with XRE-family HTH domain